MKKRVFIVLFFLLVIFSLTGCSKKDDTQTLKEKNTKALEFLDSKIFSMANKLNNIELDNYVIAGKENISGEIQSSTKDNSEPNNDDTGNDSSIINVTQMTPHTVLQNDTGSIDWDYMRYQTEITYSSCNAIILDMYQLGVNNDDILDLNTNFDNLIVAAKEENNINFLLYLRKIYGLFPKYMMTYDRNNPITYILYTKSHILNAYYYVEINDWAEVMNNLNIAEDYFKTIVNNVEFNKNKEGKVNKIYITLKELQNSIALKDKEVFLIKYKILIQDLNELT